MGTAHSATVPICLSGSFRESTFNRRCSALQVRGNAVGGGGVALLWHVSLQYKALEGTVVVI